MIAFVANNPTPTHNPRHPEYGLTEEGRRRVMRDTARNQLFVLMRRCPGKSVGVAFDGVPFAGFVPNGR